MCASKVPRKHKAAKIQETKSFLSGSRFLGNIVQRSTNANGDKYDCYLSYYIKSFRAKVPKLQQKEERAKTKEKCRAMASAS